MTNKTIGKFEILETLGQGGYGIVYRVKDTILNVERALKVLHPVLLADPTFIERFKREAQIMARLDHPHIVPVYEMDQISEHVYISMKYVPAGSLKDVLKHQGRLSFDRALEITKQIASALEYAYQQPEKLIHRDIKPSNILFEKDGSVRLSDFGFAKALSSADSISLSASGGMIGTPNYMAPEIWRGKGATAATDVYSLACVFYEMITGEMLFSGETPADIMTKHVLDEPKFPTDWSVGIPDGINGVLGKAFSKDTGLRYNTAKKFIDALNGLKKDSQGIIVPTIIIENRLIDEHGIPMKLIPSGAFMMGEQEGVGFRECQKYFNDCKEYWFDGESPVHNVWLDDYYIDVYLVTNRQFVKFLNVSNYDWNNYSIITEIRQYSGKWVVEKGHEEFPVTCVSWYDAQAYCEWRGVRLPTEAEWEKAARGGLSRKRYPWGDEKPICLQGAKNGANYQECRENGIVRIGSYAPNGYGLFDMAGNVWEWVADWYDDSYYIQSHERNPRGPYTGEERVLRGGSWDDDASDLRVAFREWNDPIQSGPHFGFRCVKDPSF
jgi:serine/threonine protein kinase